MSNDILIDARTRYNAAQTELNARLQIRSNINIAHIVVISAAAGTYSALTANRSNIFSLILAAAFPLITFYFVSLFTHNEANISNIIRNLSELELQSDRVASATTISSRFKHSQTSVEKIYQLNSMRVLSLVGLCSVAPFLLLIDQAIFVIETDGTHNNMVRTTIFGIVFAFCVVVSAINALRAYRTLKMPT